MHVNVAKELAVLEAMTVAELRARYAQMFGEETRIGSKTLLGQAHHLGLAGIG